MRALVVMPGRKHLSISLFDGEARRPSRRAVLTLPDGPSEQEHGLADALAGCLAADLGVTRNEPLDAVGIRAAFTGRHFRDPTPVTDEVIDTLRALAPSAPLHVPPLVQALQAARRAFGDTPIMLLSETAFFADLPEHETRPGLAPTATPIYHPLCMGFHGLFHAAASAHAVGQHQADGTRSTPHLLSICLEPRPELVAAIGDTPFMVTGGPTPLEGLPGHTTCGALDPSIVLLLADAFGWGPEQVDHALSKESGLLGMAGKPVTFGELWSSNDPELAAARQVMDYRILQACGAGLAAIGRVDRIVFSGQYHAAGHVLGPQLVAAFQRLPGVSPSAPTWSCMEDPIDLIIADAARALVLGTHAATR